jgi:hypothetical protein
VASAAANAIVSAVENGDRNQVCSCSVVRNVGVTASATTAAPQSAPTEAAKILTAKQEVRTLTRRHRSRVCLTLMLQ